MIKIWERASRRLVLAGLGGALTMPWPARTSSAAATPASEIRIAFGNGIGYLPFYVGQSKNLFAEALAKAGFPAVKLVWTHISGASSLNDAMLSGSIDFYVAGAPGLLIVWDRTKGRSNGVLGCAGVTTLPFSLMTVTGRLRSLSDFTPTDRIAMPSISGMPATVLRAACEQVFGPGQHGRLDRNMVALPNPDAISALLNRTEITAYLGSSPFTDLIGRDPHARALLRSPEVFKGPASFVLLSVQKAFAEANPRLVEAVVTGLQQADDFIASDPRAAAQIYLQAEPSRVLTVDLITGILRDPATEFGTRPRAIMKTAEFMSRFGELRTVPKSWTDVFVTGSERLGGD